MLWRVLLLSGLCILFSPTSYALDSADPLSEAVTAPFLGDYPEMKKDKVVRVLISYSITDYYLDNGHERGLMAEYLREFENYLNKGIKKDIDKVRVVAIPTRRDRLLTGLVAGEGDIAAANLTITEERSDTVDFSEPILTGVRELVITHKDAPGLTSVEDLSGMEIHVRKSSSYFESLVALNKTLEEAGKEPVSIVEENEWLEDEDLLEMVDAGIIPAVVVDEHVANLWLPAFKNLKSQAETPVREGGEIAWAFRKKSPELKKTVNGFVEKIREGTKLGNIFMNRYYSNIDRIINPKTDAYLKELDKLAGLFVKAGKKYNIDPMLLAAQAFQESRFNHKAKSRAGAVGIMQVLPSTARSGEVGIRNFRELEGNIEAGAKYLRFMADQYFPEKDIPDLQKILFVLAAYNAGPNRVARVRKKAEDPNMWFDSVEWQVAKAAGAEPIKYVKNIYIYYLIFSGIEDYDKQTRGAR